MVMFFVTSRPEEVEHARRVRQHFEDIGAPVAWNQDAGSEAEWVHRLSSDEARNGSLLWIVSPGSLSDPALLEQIRVARSAGAHACGLTLDSVDVEKLEQGPQASFVPLDAFLASPFTEKLTYFERDGRPVFQTDMSELTGSFHDVGARRGSGRFVRFADVIRDARWPVTDCSQQVPATEQAYIFLSHRWLSTDHPDPVGVKFARLKAEWDALVSFQHHVRSLDPGRLDRSARESLCDERLRVSTLMLRQDLTELHLWRGGYKPNDLLGTGWLDDDTTPAARALLQWLDATVQRVLDATLWIDSWATALASHRRTCVDCQRIHDETLARLPEILANADVCHYLGGMATDELSRGWIQLELASADLHDKLTGVGPTGAVSEARNRLMALDYECSADHDDVSIPRLLAAQHALYEYERSRPPRVFAKSPASAAALRQVTDAITVESGGGVLRDCERLVETVRAPDVCRGLEAPPVHAGRFLIESLAIGLWGIASSHARRQRVSPRAYGDILTIVKAMAYALICDARLPDRVVAEMLLLTWTETTGANLGLSRVRPIDDFTYARVMGVMRNTYELWMDGSGRTIDISIVDLCREPLPEVSAQLAYEPKPVTVELAGCRSVMDAVFGPLMQAVGDQATCLGIGDAIRAETLRARPDRVPARVLFTLYDDRLWPTAKAVLQRAASTTGRTIGIYRLSGASQGELEPPDRFTFRASK